MDLTLEVWRQAGPDAARSLRDLRDAATSARTCRSSSCSTCSTSSSNAEGEEPVAFDHDCREGICGSCAMMIDGRAHGPETGTATCQLHLRKLNDGATITVEPWRAAGFPIIKDLAVDRSAFDRIVEAGGYITAPTGSGARRQRDPRARRRPPTRRWTRPRASAAARAWPRARTARRSSSPRRSTRTSTCCPRASPSATRGSSAMVEEMEQYFGSCTNHGECEEACPKEISIDFIAMLNRDYVKAQFKNTRLAGQTRLTRARCGDLRPPRRVRAGRPRSPIGMSSDAAVRDATTIAGRRRQFGRPTGRATDRVHLGR